MRRQAGFLTEEEEAREGAGEGGVGDAADGEVEARVPLGIQIVPRRDPRLGRRGRGRRRRRGRGGGGVLGRLRHGEGFATRGEGPDAIRGRQKETHRERRRQRGRRWLLALALSLRECRALEPFGSGAKAWQSGPIRAGPGQKKASFVDGQTKWLSRP